MVPPAPTSAVALLGIHGIYGVRRTARNGPLRGTDVGPGAGSALRDPLGAGAAYGELGCLLLAENGLMLRLVSLVRETSA